MGIFPIFLACCAVYGILYGLYCMVMTPVLGLRLRKAKKGTEAYDNRLRDFKRVWKGLLIFLCVLACGVVLAVVLGGLMIANM